MNIHFLLLCYVFSILSSLLGNPPLFLSFPLSSFKYQERKRHSLVTFFLHQLKRKKEGGGGGGKHVEIWSEL
jgi:hypothetical protein